MPIANPGDSTADRTGDPRHLPKIGPYQCLRVLGEGAMGVVYLAEQTRPLRRQVALKLVRPGLDSKQVVARFERERQAMAVMNHPHVARVFDAGETDDHRPYFVMEYVDGVHVTKYCDLQKLGNADRLKLFLKIGEAAQHAHEKGIIHRDLKPSNILVSGPREQPSPKVIDFGVAKAIGQQLTADTFATQFGQWVGTPAYMSPEQANPMFEDVDIRTDVYSLGVLLYELISGVPPLDFEGMKRASYTEIRRVILEEEPTPPSTRISSLGEEASTIAEKHGTDVQHMRRELKGDLDCIVLHALEKERSRRYATVADFTRDIEHYLRSEPISPRRGVFTYRVRKFIRRRRAPLITGGLATALLVSTALGGWALRARDVQAALDSAAIAYLETRSMLHTDPAAALLALRAIVEQNPENLPARHDLARLLHHQNRIPEAIAVAEAIVAGGQDTGPAHLLLSQLYKYDDRPRADSHAAEARRLLPGDLYHQALILPDAESERAAELLTLVLEKEGANFEAAWNRAWRYYRLGRYTDMLADADFLTRWERRSPLAWNTHGIALASLGRLEEAITSFSKAIEFAPNHALTYLNRADAYRNLKNYKEALSNCNEAIRRGKDFPNAYAHRAGVYLAQKQLERAREDCETALRRQPDNALAHWYLGQLFEQSEANEQALAEYEAAVVAEPRNSNFRLSRAELRRKMEDCQGAIDDYTAVLARNDRHSGAYFGRGRARARLDQLDAALADFGEAIEIAPDQAGYFHQRARILRWRLEYRRALEDNQVAVSLAPGGREPLVGRALTHWLIEDLDQAIADLRQAVQLGREKAPPYLFIWLWHLHSMRQEPQAAAGALQEAAASADTDWEKSIIQFLRGELTAEALQTQATGALQKCEALYYIGVKAQTEGGLATAAEFFRQAIDLNFRDCHEYDLARGHYARILAATAAHDGA